MVRRVACWLALALLPLLWVIAVWALAADAVHVFSWWLALTLPGWLVWPFVTRLTPAGSQGYLLAKALGLLLPALALWLASFWGLLPFTRSAMVPLLLLAGFGAWGAYRRRSHLLQLLKQPAFLTRLFASEALFTASLLLAVFARGLKPELDSLEKFMNVGLMNSLWRTNWLPALDTWFSGKTVNYYYFGQYCYTYLAKLTAIRPEVAYNLGMATTFAFTLTLAYTLVAGLVLSRDRSARTWKGTLASLSGLWGALLVSLAGNGHAFFFGNRSPGRQVTRWLINRGFLASSVDKPYWFADATRFIGYNPDTTDKTIHEFPFYSFLVADLHAHVINLTFVLVFLIVMAALVGRPRLVQSMARCCREQDRADRLDDLGWYQRTKEDALDRLRVMVTDPLLLVSGLLLAVFMMGNYWDFAIYLAVAALVLLVTNYQGSSRKKLLPGVIILLVQAAFLLLVYLRLQNPLLAVWALLVVWLINQGLTLLHGDALTVTGAQVSWLFLLAHGVSLPFNRSFEPISKTIARTQATTPISQLLLLWGPHLLATGLFALMLVWVHHRRQPRVFPPPAGTGLRGGRRFYPLDPADRLLLVFFLWSVCLLLLPELVYVVDIYSGSFKRANTMFKFTYQAFLLLSLIWAAAPGRLLQKSGGKGRWPRRILAGFLLLGLVVPFWYTVPAASQWLGAFKRARYQGLDGLAPLALKDSAQIPGQLPGELAADVAAIRWLNETVTGQPLVLEADGESYTDFCRISAMTGLPTILGWETHEWLWRTSRDTPDAYSAHVLPRQQDIRLIYTTDDQALRQELLARYQVAYLVIGDLERARFTDQTQTRLPEELLQACGSVVFSQGSLLVIQVDQPPVR